MDITSACLECERKKQERQRREERERESRDRYPWLMPDKY